MMSRTELKHVRAVLEVLNEWYESSHDLQGPYGSSQIMDDDRGFQEHVAQALKEISR